MADRFRTVLVAVTGAVLVTATVGVLVGSDTDDADGAVRSEFTTPATTVAVPAPTAREVSTW